jgi:hypothetical protein
MVVGFKTWHIVVPEDGTLVPKHVEAVRLIILCK